MAACSSVNYLRCARVLLPMVKMSRALPAGWMNCNRILYQQLSCVGTQTHLCSQPSIHPSIFNRLSVVGSRGSLLCSQRHASTNSTSSSSTCISSSLGGQKVSPDPFYAFGYYIKPASCFGEVGGRRSYSTLGSCSQTHLFRCQQASPQTLLQGGSSWNEAFIRQQVTETSPSSVAPVFVVMKFDKEGNVATFEKKKTELCQELSLQARDLRFQHSTSLTTRNNCIIIRMESLKAVVTPHSVLVFDFRGLAVLERWLVRELAPQLASQTAHSLPFEFKALEAILLHRVNTLQGRLNEVHPVIMDTLESLVDPQLLSADRSKLHVLLQNSKSLSELETDIKVFKDSLLKIMDEEEIIEELCLTKWTDPRVFEESSLGIDHAEEMELLLENYYMQAQELADEARELRGLIDDSESVIFINLDSHRNVMMRLNLQLTMGTFSLSLFGLIGVAFGMNLQSSFEEDPRVFWLVTGFMFMGSGLIWRRLLSFLGRNLEPSRPPQIPPVWKRNLKPPEVKTGVR